MSKYLVIVESPAKAKTIKKFLGSDFDILASYGHVRDLPTHTLGVDLNDNYAPRYTELKEKQKVLKDLKKHAKSAECIYLATDPDREGEAIAWHIQESLDIPSDKIQRVVFNEITKRAVTDAVQHPRGLDPKLVDAQQARRILDRLIGYKLSPVLSKKIKKGLSAGRVQSVATKLICDREKEILAFVPQEYWVIEADLGIEKTTSLLSKLWAKDTPESKLKITTEKEARAIETELKKSAFSVYDLSKKVKQRHPYPPFITSTLQQEGSRKLNWSAKKTMLIAQQLYEGVEVNGEHLGLITYMRTDSTRLSDDAVKDIQAHILSEYGSDYVPEKARVFKTKKGAQDAHEAIRPSYFDQTPEKLKAILSKDHYNLYKLIWDRTIASRMASASIEYATLLIEAKHTQSYFFKATGNRILFDGFMSLYIESKDPSSEDEEGNTTLPPLEKGAAFKVNEITANQKFTQPPFRYTEASLVKELEELGIGRPSTYAPTISTIQDRGYVDKEKRNLFPTELGLLVSDKLTEFFTTIVDVNFTAEMETKLDEIMEGKHQWQNIVGEIYTPFVDLISEAYDKMEKVNLDKPTELSCEKCGKPMVIKSGRFGEFLACTGFPDCKNTQPLPAAAIEAKCPECSSDLIQKKTRKGKVFFGCSTFPACDFASWDKPVNTPCPDCGASLLFELQKKGKESALQCKSCKKTIELPSEE